LKLDELYVLRIDLTVLYKKDIKWKKTSNDNQTSNLEEEMNYNRTRDYSNAEQDEIIKTIQKRKTFFLIFGLSMAVILSTFFLAIQFQMGYIISIILALYGFGASLYCANTIDYITKGTSRMTFYKIILLILGGFVGTLAAVFVIDKVQFLSKLALGINI